MYLRFWGTRGLIATPGPSTTEFGGNTSCVEVVTNSGARFILDCGTGARSLGAHLMAHAPKPILCFVRDIGFNLGIGNCGSSPRPDCHLPQFRRHSQFWIRRFYRPINLETPQAISLRPSDPRTF